MGLFCPLKGRRGCRAALALCVEMLRFGFCSWVLECGSVSPYQMSGQNVQNSWAMSPSEVCVSSQSLPPCCWPLTVPLPQGSLEDDQGFLQPMLLPVFSDKEGAGLSWV